MSDQTHYIAREVLNDLFKGNKRVVRQFEDMQRRVAVSEDTSSANLEATQALEEAVFITLSENAELPNERVLVVGEGIDIDTSEDGKVKLSVKVRSPNHTVQFTANGAATLGLPINGVLATRANAETFENKTLAAPKVTGLGDYADDAAASAGGVPVGGLYRNGLQVMVRVA